MINAILPLRTGELSFIYMISKNEEKKTTALASLITTKIFDFVAVSCLFIIALIFLGINEKRFLLLGAGLIAVVICGSFLLFVVIKYYALFKNKMLMRIRVYKYTITKVGEILSDLKKIGDIKKSSLVFLISLGVWISNFLTAYFIVVAMNIKIGLYLTVLAFTFTAIISYLPIHGFFGFGTLEAEWTMIFMFFGVSKEIAISSGFGFHIINILYFLILGVIGLINLNRFELSGKNK